MVDIRRTNDGFRRPDTDIVFPTRQAAKQWEPKPVLVKLKKVQEPKDLKEQDDDAVQT